MMVVSTHKFRPVIIGYRNGSVEGQANSSKSWREVVKEDAIIMICRVSAIRIPQKGYMDLTA